MELHQLEYAIKVSEHMNFTHASDELHLAQPSLSQQISNLEAELGIRIFERSTRSVKLTPAGKEFLICAKRVLLEVSRTRQSIQKYIAVEKGRLSIGIMPMNDYLGLTKLIAAFMMRYPGVDIEIKEAGAFDLIQDLYATKIDLALMTILEDYIFKIPLDSYPLLKDELVLITPLFHAFAGKEVIAISELADQRWILPRSTHGLHHIIRKMCQDAGFKPQVVCEISQAETTAGLVSAGIGISALSRRIATVLLAEHNFSIVKIAPLAFRSTALVIPPGPHHQPTITAFMEFTLAWAKGNV